MKLSDIKSFIRGKAEKKAVSNKNLLCPKDKVIRNFRAPAPNMLGPFSDAKGIVCRVAGQRLYPCLNRWLAGEACTAERVAERLAWLLGRWRPHAELYVVFFIDTFAGKIVGWRVSSSPKTGCPLDALEQPLHDRRPVHKTGLIHHSDRPCHGLLCRP
ncbi:MAG: transposase InsO family protein [Paracoccaceae bacterium]|jgi:transposase InsO family protein